MKRLKSGVPGLDELMKGGIPNNQLVLLTGTSGTGKTIMCSQFIYEGVKTYKESGVYLSFEEPVDFIKKNMLTFGWDFERLERSGRFAFIKYDPFRIEDIFEILESNIRHLGAKRVVIDSISALALHVGDQAELRRMIFSLSLLLRRLGCTAIIVSEIVQGSTGISRYGVEEFVADSVIVLYYERLQSTFSRAVQVWKLRGSDHSYKLHPYTISDKGIAIAHREEALKPIE